MDACVGQVSHTIRQPSVDAIIKLECFTVNCNCLMQGIMQCFSQAIFSQLSAHIAIIMLTQTYKVNKTKPTNQP